MAGQQLILTEETPAADDVATRPDRDGDPREVVEAHLPADILARYEVFSYRNAALILKQAHPAEFAELMDALRAFRITTAIIQRAGGNESEIPKVVSAQLRPKGWRETTIQADLLVRLLSKRQETTKSGKLRNVPDIVERTRENYLDGHKVDYVKGKVAFDLEWNSKDQTFDRDLYAFSAFAQCGVIDVGVLLTRSAALDTVFAALGKQVKAKYGASTTWMGKLLYRLNAGRNGGCPVLAIGIKPECVEDWQA